MVSSSFYKIAFWVLLSTVLVFQIIISAVAFRPQPAPPQLLLRNGHLPPVPDSRHSSPKTLPIDAQHVQGQQRSIPPEASASDSRAKVWEEVLSSSPRIVLLHNFATKQE